jgi:hypothetical protein
VEDQLWFSDMQRDPLNRARNVIRILRSSDQRKQEFESVIKSGNESGWYNNVTVPNLELLRDVKTRWDSTYIMIQRLQQLRPVSLQHLFQSSRLSMIPTLAGY